MKTWNRSSLTPKISLILSIALAALTFESFSAVINVPAQHVTIQAAVNAATDGDTVRVGDGTYLEKVNINKNIILESVNGRASTIIDGSAVPVGTGTILLQGPRSGVTIGGLGKGFTIIGSDSPSPGIEWAAIYGTTSLSNISIIDNEIRANGDGGLILEYGLSGSNILIDRNEFSGKTFVGDNPAGLGFGDQFTLANVPRQLVTIGNGGADAPSALTNVTFTNNVISGTAGGLNPSNIEQGNTLVTIDSSSSTISNNLFQGATTASASALRMRRPNTFISNNVFDSSNMGASTLPLFVVNQTQTVPQLQAANGFDKGAIVTGGGAWPTIGAAITAAPANGEINVLPGTYVEGLLTISKTLKLRGAKAGVPAGPMATPPDRGVAGEESILEGRFEIGTAIDGVEINGFHIQSGTATAISARGLNTVISNNLIKGSSTADSFFGIVTRANAPTRIHSYTITANNIQTFPRLISMEGSGDAAPSTVTNNYLSDGQVGIQVLDLGQGHVYALNVFDGLTTGGFSTTRGNGLIERNTFKDCVGYGVRLLGTTNLSNNTIRENSFENNGIAIFLPTNHAGAINNRAYNNNFEGNTLAVSSAHAAVFDASANWWGTTDPAAVAAKISGTGPVDVTPLLVANTDTAPATPGFQGDFSEVKIVTTGPQSGAPTFSRIQEAIDLDSDGGLIAVPGGTYAGNVDSTAKSVILAAGASPGQVVVNGDFTLDSDDTLEVEIETNVPGAGYDQWVINGDISLGGATLDLSGAYTPAGGDSLAILDNQGGNPITGAFAGLAAPETAIPNFLGSGIPALASYDGGDGDDFEINFPSFLVVQQPSGTDLTSPAAVSFASAFVSGGFIDRTFVIRNDGLTPVTGITITGLAAPFTLLSAPPSSLALGESATLTVRFSPTVAGAAAGSLTLKSSEPDFVVNLSGTGVALPVAANGNAINDNGSVLVVVGGTRTVTVTVLNASTYRLTLNTGGTWNQSGPGLSVSTVNLDIDKAQVNELFITDADGAVLSVIMTGSATQSFDHDTTVVLNSGTGGSISGSNGARCVFTGGKTFTAVNEHNGITLGTNTSLCEFSVVGAGTVTLDAAGAISMSANASISAVDGAVTLTSKRSITVNTSASITTADGNITLTANKNFVNSGSFNGIDILGPITTSGLGSIDIRGWAGDGGNNNRGIRVSGEGQVKVVDASASIILEGYGRAGGTFTGADGIQLNGSNVLIEAGEGGISLVGDASGATGSGGSHYGIEILGGAKVKTTNGGGISIDAFGGKAGANATGIMLSGSNTLVQSEDGQISIYGVGGSFTGAGNVSAGILVDAGALVQSTGAGDVSLEGLAGAGRDVGNTHIGVRIGSGATTQGVVKVKDGDLDISGTGGGGSGTGRQGVLISRGKVESTGSGSISIIGKADNASQNAFEISNNSNAELLSSGTGATLIQADRMVIGAASVVDVAANTITLQPDTAARPVLLGAASSASALGLTSAQLNRVNADRILATGKLAVDSRGGHLTIQSALTLTRVGTLELDASGAELRPTAAGTDVTVTNLIVTAGSTIPVNITTAVADTGYPRLIASGSIDITGADLIVTGGFNPPLATVFTVVDSTARTGTFNGLPDGYEYITFLGTVPPKKAVLNYTASAATLTVQGQPEIKLFAGPLISDPALADDQATAIDFGSNLAVGQPVTRDFTIQNTGTGSLTVSGITAPSGYVVMNAPVAPIAPGAAHTFQVKLTGSHIATFSGNVVVTHNDPVDPVAPAGSFQFPVTGQVGTMVTVDSTDPAKLIVTAGVSVTGDADLLIRVYAYPDRYELVRLAVSGPHAPVGPWVFSDSATVYKTTGSFTNNTLVILKTNLDKLRIFDAPGLFPARSMNIDFLGRGSDPDDLLINHNFGHRTEVELNDSASIANITFSGKCKFAGSASLRAVTTRGRVNSPGSDRWIEMTNGDLYLEGAPFVADYGLRFQGIVRSVGTGKLHLKGTGFGANAGVRIEGGKVQSSGGGAIEIEGYGGVPDTAGGGADGVRLHGASPEVASASGEIKIKGIAATQPTHARSDKGIAIESNAKVRSSDENNVVNIILEGVGATTGSLLSSSRDAYGIGFATASPGSEVSNSKGSITLKGFGGGLPVNSLGLANYGVSIGNNGQVKSTGTATITIEGTGGSGGSSNMSGVFISDTDAAVKAGVIGGDGEVTILGVSGGQSAGTNNRGVVIQNVGSEIKSAGTGKISITARHTLPTNTAEAFSLSSGSITSTSTQGDFEIISDRMTIADTAQINVGNIAFTTYTAGRMINLGGADSVAELGLTDAELDRVLTAGRITVGSASSGKLTVTAAITTVASGAELELASGGDIEIPAAGSLASLGDVKFNTTAGKVLPIRTGTDVTAGGSVTFAAGTTLQLPLNGTTADSESGYRVLGVTGGVNLNGAKIEFVGGFQPLAGNLGDKLFIIQNDGILDAVVGIFDGWPQGSIIPLLNGSEYGAKFNYAGGDGNDVELEIVATSLINGYEGLTAAPPAFLKPSGSTVNFGFPAFGQVVTRDITLKNTGTAPLNVTAITVTGESPASPPIQYTILGTPVPTILSGDTYTFQVQLNPLTVGVVSATVNVASDDPGTPVLSFNVTGTVSTFSYAASMPGFTGPTANIVLDGGKTVTISVPDHTVAPGNAFPYPHYRLQLTTGFWGGENTAAITGNGTNALIVNKSLVDNVSIIDSNAAGTNAVTFFGRGLATVTGRTFDDRFVVVLDGPGGGAAVAGLVSFTGDCEFTGANSLEVSTLRNITVSAGADITVVDGDLTWNANQGLVPTSGSFLGILNNGRIVTTGKGDIYMKARGGDGSSEGGIRLIGTSLDACRVESTGGPGLPGGKITLLGTGGASNSSASYGVELRSQHVTVQSASGDITIEGGTTSTGTSPYGVYVNGAKVEASGSDPVNISITGTGSNAANFGAKYGVSVSGASAKISAEKGSITIHGTGGSLVDFPWNVTSDDNYGVLVQAGATIESTGTDSADAATISITGIAGLGGDDDHRGVFVSGTGTKVTTDAGDLTLNGTGGGRNDPGSANCAGIYVSGSAVIESTGEGNVKLSGTAGAAAGVATNAGILLTGTGTELSTDAAGATGTLTLEADQINIAATASIEAGSNDVVFQPKTAGFPVAVGGADSISQLGILQPELNRVLSAGKIVFGSATSGAISILGAITPSTANGPPAATDFEVRSGANIDFVHPGKLTSAGGDVTFLPGTYLLPGTNGVDVDAGLGTVFLGSGNLRAVLNGTILDSGYTQLNVIGALELTGSGLELTGTWTPVDGSVLTLVQNDLADSISGIFTGRPENYVFDPVLPLAPNKGRLTYLGTDGTGNDVVLEIGVPNAKFVFGTDEIANTGTAAFGNVSPGYTKTVTVTVQNEGNVSLVLFPSVSVGGSNPLQFTLSPTGGWGSTITLAPSASTTFDVTFLPSALGPYSATLSFNSNDPADNPFAVSLTGTGAIPPAVPVDGLGSVLTGNGAPGEDGVTEIGQFGTLYRAGFMALDGSLVFPGILQTSPSVTLANNAGIWKLKAGDDLKLLLRKGFAAPDTGGATYSVLPTGAPAINTVGLATVMAQLGLGTGTPGTTTADDTGLWSEVGDGTLRLVVRSGDLTPGGQQISQIGRGTPSTSGAAWSAAQKGADKGEVAFVTSYVNNVAGVTSANATAILRADLDATLDTVALTEVARQGSTAPGTVPAATFANLNNNDTDPMRMDPDGNFGFVAPLSGSRTGVFYKPTGAGALVKVFEAAQTLLPAAGADVAPGTGGATFRSLQVPSLGAGGYMVFRATLNQNGDNAANTKNDGIWAGVATNPGGFTCLLRRGDIVPGPVGSPPWLQYMVGNTWGGFVTQNGDNRSAFRAWVDINAEGLLSSRGNGHVYGIYANTYTDNTMRLIAKEGDNAPGLPAGYKFDYFDHPIVGGLNQVAFIGEAKLGASIIRGVWRQSPNGGPLFLLLKVGDTVTTTAGVLTVDSISLPGAEANRAVISGTRRIEQPVMDENGAILVWITFGGSENSQVILP